MIQTNLDYAIADLTWKGCNLTTFTILKVLGLDQRCPLRAWYYFSPSPYTLGISHWKERIFGTPVFETVSPSNSLFFSASCDLDEEFLVSWSHCSCHIILLTITIPVSPCIFPSLAQIVLGTLRLHPCRNRGLPERAQILLSHQLCHYIAAYHQASLRTTEYHIQ